MHLTSVQQTVCRANVAMTNITVTTELCELTKPYQHCRQHILSSLATPYTVSGKIYEGIQKALGPTQYKTTPLKTTNEEVITDKGEQIDR